MAGEKQRRGRPRKWSSDAERMRAYRARRREGSARLVDPEDGPEALIDNGRLRERIAQLEDERDRLWAQIIRLQAERRAGGSEAAESDSHSAGPAEEQLLSRAERRRREREAAKRARRRA